MFINDVNSDVLLITVVSVCICRSLLVFLLVHFASKCAKINADNNKWNVLFILITDYLLPFNLVFNVLFLQCRYSYWVDVFWLYSFGVLYDYRIYTILCKTGCDYISEIQLEISLSWFG